MSMRTADHQAELEESIALENRQNVPIVDMAAAYYRAGCSHLFKLHGKAAPKQTRRLNHVHHHTKDGRAFVLGYDDEAQLRAIYQRVCENAGSWNSYVWNKPFWHVTGSGGKLSKRAAELLKELGVHYRCPTDPPDDRL